MPPKEKPSKKAVKEKQSKQIDDATFGLKNKNKSKKVQQFIERVEKTVKFNPDGAKAKEAKEAKKLAKQLQEEEMRLLFNEGITNQFGKKKSKAQAAADGMGISETNKDFAKLLEEMSSDDESDDDDDEFNKQKQSYGDMDDNNQDSQLEVIEIFREKTIEDIIEEQREKLAAQGKVGTPVTAESFAKWRAGKLAQRQADAEARMRMEQAKKKGSKGLSVLSGKELFNYNASLFVDDDAAIDASEENALNLETSKEEEEEEKKAMREAEKAQEEQLRLAEIARIEDDENTRQDEEKRSLAALENRETFLLGNVVINKIVFDVKEREDLEEFLFDEESDEDDDDDDDDDDEEDNDNDDENDNNADDDEENEEDNTNIATEIQQQQDGDNSLNLDAIKLQDDPNGLKDNS